MTNRVGLRAGVLAPIACALAAGITLSAQQGRFRSSVDVIAVDVQVVDKEGFPVGPLDAQAFQVSINNHKRKVASAQFIRHSWSDLRVAEPTAGAPPAAAGETVPGGGRTFIIAVDNGSFDIGTAKETMDAVKMFVSRLEPQDRIGLYVFPSDVWLPPTTERAPIRVRLDRVIGDRQPMKSYYNLSASEIVDITAQATNPNSFLTAIRNANDPSVAELDPVRMVQRRECRGDPNCLARIYAEGMELAGRLEDQTQTSLNGMWTLLQRLTDMPGRKAVVIVSGGVLVSDRLDGRPDIGNQGKMLGQVAARANATVYTLHIDANAGRTGTADKRGSGDTEHGRERMMYSIFLDQFSSAAGGQRLYVPVGGGDPAFDRVLRESAAYYLLGVEPQETDRDGKPRELKVKVNKRGVTVRSRQWVLVPARERPGN